MTESPIAPLTPEAPLEPVEPVPSTSSLALAILVAGLGFFIFITLGAFIQMLSVPFGLWFSEIFIFLALPVAALALSGRSPLKTAGLRKPWVAGIAFGLFIGVANFFIGAMPLMWVGQHLVPHEWLEFFDSSIIFRDKSSFEIGVIVAAVTFAAPFCEEFFFRGVLQPGVASVTNPIRAVVLVALWFSFCHLDPVGFLARWELGIVFGLLYWRTGSLWPGMAAHLGNNLTSSALFLALRDQAEEPASEGTQLLAVAAFGAVLLGVAYALAKFFPRVLQSPEPAVETFVKSPGVLRAFGPWVLTGALSLALFFGLNGRQASVNLVDTLSPVKPAKKDASEADKAAYEEAKALRKRALDGELPLRDYFQQRIERSKAWPKKPAVPAPPQPADPPVPTPGAPVLQE